MPLLKIQTNTAVDNQKSQRLLKSASQRIAGALNKPEQYMMVSLDANVPIMFAGTGEPAAFVELKGIGLPTAKTGELSRLICELIASELGVGGTSRLAYTKADYGSFRLIFTARMNPVNNDHLGVLFWGDRPADPAKPKIDNAGWIQFMPPLAGMWDYHPPKHHNLPFQKLAQGSKDSTKWCTTEILCNLENGTMRAAVDGVELARHTHPTPSERQDPEKRIIAGPIGMFRHGGGASEYKDIYLEANPKEDRLITVR